MSLINLTNIFGITPFYNAAAPKGVNFKGSEQVFGLPAENFVNDGFTSNPLNKYFKSKAEIEQLAKSNPRIMALLKEHNLSLRVNMDVLEDM